MRLGSGVESYRLGTAGGDDTGRDVNSQSSARQGVSFLMNLSFVEILW